MIYRRRSICRLLEENTPPIESEKIAGMKIRQIACLHLIRISIILIIRSACVKIVGGFDNELNQFMMADLKDKSVVLFRWHPLRRVYLFLDDKL